MNNLNADIVIVGGGMAGFAAALAAAGEDRSVLLVERQQMLGGNATQSNVGTICGAYYRSVSGPAVFAGHLFGYDLINELIGAGICSEPIMHHNGLYVLHYHWSQFHNFLEKKLVQAGVVVLKNTEVQEVCRKGNRIDHLITAANDTKTNIRGLAFVDCSGNAILSRLAKIDVISTGNYQAASQVFRVTGIEGDNEFTVNMSLKRLISRLIAVKNFPESYRSISVVPGSLENGAVDIKFTLPDKISDDVALQQMLTEKSKSYVQVLFETIKNNTSIFRDAVIENIFPMPGIRTQQRSKGKYILTGSDVLECRKFDNYVALGTWPIEEWFNDGGLSLEYFGEDSCYHIPAECLTSGVIDNLFFAGKNISADDKAIASARVIGTCLQTGYAAGKMAACPAPDAMPEIIRQLKQDLEAHV